MRLDKEVSFFMFSVWKTVIQTKSICFVNVLMLVTISLVSGFYYSQCIGYLPLLIPGVCLSTQALDLLLELPSFSLQRRYLLIQI